MAWALVLVIVGASVYAYQLGRTNLAGTSNNVNTGAVVNSTPAEVPVTGNFACLPSKTGAMSGKLESDGTHNAACTVGLMTLDGHYYALNMSNVQVFDGNYSPDRKVWVVGTETQTGDEALSALKYDGVIAVRAIVPNNK